jgi:hypothetical protein
MSERKADIPELGVIRMSQEILGRDYAMELRMQFAELLALLGGSVLVPGGGSKEIN